MGDDVSGGEIITKEEIFETEGGDKNQAACGDTRLPGALDQKRMSREDRGDSASKCIHRTNKSQDESERTEYIHGDSADPPAEPGPLHVAVRC